MSRPRYWIWCIKPIKANLLMLVGLGYRRQCLARWHQLTDGELSIQLHHLAGTTGTNVRYFRCRPYAKCRTKKEAMEILLNLRMQHPLINVEDWTHG